MKIAVFGGTFDPPHRAHTQLVASVLEQGLFDQVWYVPVFRHQKLFAKEQMTAAEHRLKMLELVQTGATKIETYEIDQAKPSHTHTTLKALSQKYPQDQFSFLMGSDQLPSLHKWNCEQDERCFPQAADEFEYYVYPRAGYPMEPLPFSNLKPISSVEPMDDSSTRVRAAVEQGRDITDLVSQPVADYIEKHSLYR